MAIKDIIGPGFVGTTTIKWIVTRGLSIGSLTVPDVPGMEYAATGDQMHYRAAEQFAHYSTTDERFQYQAKEP